MTGGQERRSRDVLVESESAVDAVFVNTAGTFVFSTVADYQAGRPLLFSQRVGDPTILVSGRRIARFAQDDVAIRPGLSIGLGVRWETERGAARSSGWAPRVRAAWTVGATTVHGGAGIYYRWVGLDLFREAQRLDGVHQRDLLVFNPGFPDPGASGESVFLPPSVVRLAPGLTLPRSLRVVAGVERKLGLLGQVRVVSQWEASRTALRATNANAPGADGVRPHPEFGNITFVEARGFARKRSLRASYEWSRPQPRMLVTATYILGSSENDADGPLTLPSDNRDPAADRGPGADDIRHQAFGTFYVGLTRSWLISAGVSAMSGAPYSVTTGRDDNGDGTLNDRPPGVGRNGARGAWQTALNAQIVWRRELSRRPVGGTAPARSGAAGRVPAVTLRLEGENLLNRTNPRGYVGVLTSPLFRTATSAGPRRRLGLSLSLNF